MDPLQKMEGQQKALVLYAIHWRVYVLILLQNVALSENQAEIDALTKRREELTAKLERYAGKSHWEILQAESDEVDHIRRFVDENARKTAQLEREYQALHDELTGLATQSHFMNTAVPIGDEVCRSYLPLLWFCSRLLALVQVQVFVHIYVSWYWFSFCLLSGLCPQVQTYLLDRIEELRHDAQRGTESGMDLEHQRREESVCLHTRAFVSLLKLRPRQKDLDAVRATVSQLRQHYARKKKDFENLMDLHTEAQADLQETRYLILCVPCCSGDGYAFRTSWNEHAKRTPNKKRHMKQLADARAELELQRRAVLELVSPQCCFALVNEQY